ncbi:MAG: hypothetical protein K6F99_10665 [Lachnospiraceae bacterium]|nr:hypothetical protein [Lachnospiraceae bacterium]
MAEENVNIDGQQAEGEAVNGETVEIEESGEVKEKLPPPEEHLKTRYIPAIVTLLGTAVIAISCFIRQYPLMNMLVTLLFTIVFFWFMGAIIKILLDRIVIKPKPETEEPEETEEEQPVEKSDGAVIEK